MVSSNRGSREQRRAEKADMMFGIYFQMGPDRSLLKLLETCTAIGLRISLNTLKTYSSKFGWQARLLDMNNKVKEERERDSAHLVNQMNQTHAQYSRALLGLFSAGINNYNQILQLKRDDGKPQTLDISFQDLTRILEVAQRTERLARGEATSRSEIMIDVISLFVKEFARIFLGVITMVTDTELQEKIKALYIQRCDEMIRTITPGAEAGNLNLIDRGR